MNADYATAKRRALASLCEDIRVVVQSESMDERRHKLKQVTVNNRPVEEVMSFDELTRVVNRTSARCVFEGMPVKETRDDVGGQSYVWLKLRVSDYIRYMAGRTAAVEVDMGDSSLAGDSLAALVADHLRGKGYLAVVKSGAPSHFRAAITFRPSTQETSTEFNNLIVGTAELTYQLTKISTGVEIESEHISGLKARGFKTDSVLDDLLKRAVDGLKGVL